MDSWSINLLSIDRYSVKKKKKDLIVALCKILHILLPIITLQYIIEAFDILFFSRGFSGAVFFFFCNTKG
jgi:hypothetical protein